MKIMRRVEYRILSIAFTVFLLQSAVAGAAPETTLQMTVGEAVFVPTNKVERVAVASPDVADTIVLPDKEGQLMVNAKSPGFTSMNIWDKDGQRTYSIFVSRASIAFKSDVYYLKNYTLTRPYVEAMSLTVSNNIDKGSVEMLVGALSPVLGSENITVDPYNNIVVLRGTDSELAAAKSILDAIDKPVPQVIIEARVMELTEDDLKKMGMTMFGQRRRVSGEVNLLDQDAMSSMTFDTLQNLAKRFSITKEQFNEMMTGNTLTNPKVTTRDGSTAMILVGTKYPVAKLDQVNPQYTTVTYTYVETGISLAIRPHVGDNGMVALWIRPEVSAISGWVGDPNSITGNAAPIIDTREAVTDLSVKDGEPIFIGGLKRTFDTVTRSKVPYLGDIPIIGKIFRKTNKESKATELVIVITPHILREGEKYEEIEKDFADSNKEYMPRFTPPAVMPEKPAKPEENTSTEPRSAAPAEPEGDASAAQPRDTTGQVMAGEAGTAMPREEPAAQSNAVESTEPEAAMPSQEAAPAAQPQESAQAGN